MTTTNAVGNSSAANAASSVGSGSLGATSASAAYDTFLTLLTTQLQNQDPMNPTDTSTFTSEMIQLSGVEQDLNINNTLDTMSSDLSSISASNGLGYIGKSVTATGSTTTLQSGTANWDYDLSSTATNVTLNVQDSSGNTVYSTSGSPTAGEHSFSWNGNTSAGTAVPAGDYTCKWRPSTGREIPSAQPHPSSARSPASIRQTVQQNCRSATSPSGQQRYSAQQLITGSPGNKDEE